MFDKVDPALAGDATIARRREELPDAGCVALPGAGHHIREDDPEACVAAILEVFAAVQ